MLDVHDGYALAIIRDLGQNPGDEYEMAHIIEALVDAVMDDPEGMAPVAQILLHAWRTHDRGGK